MARIKNCPFCGYTAGITVTPAKTKDDTDKYIASCMNQFCIASKMSFRYKSHEDAVTGWNYRVERTYERGSRND